MTISNIDKKLQPQLPHINLSSELFETDVGLTTLFEKYFFDSKGIVSIDVDEGGYHVDLQQGIITCTGTGRSNAFNGQTITNLTIKMIKGSPQVAITAELKEDISLHDLFSSLRAPIIQSLNFRDADLFWASYDSNADDTVTGYYFQGSLDFDNPPLDFIKLFFDDVVDTTLWGQITMQGTTKGSMSQYVPDMILQMDASKNSKRLGPLTIHGPTFLITSNPFFNASDLRWQTDDKIKISVAVSFGDTQFELVLELNDTNENLIFKAILGVPLAGALDKIIQMIGGVNLSVPAFDVPKDKDLYLEDIEISYNIKQSTLNLITVDVGMPDGEKWNLWDQVFLENIHVSFQVESKPGGGYQMTGGQLYGVVSDWLALSADFADDGNYVFAARLADPGKPVTIKSLYTFFTNKTNDELPDLNVTTFYIELERSPDDKGGSKFSFDGNIVINGEWDLVTQPEKISIDGLNFYLKHSETETNFKAGGIFGVSDYIISLEAGYDTQNGWSFTGDLELEDEKPGISDVNNKINAIGNKPSKPTNIPPYLSDWYVQNMHTAFQTATKNFDFTLAIKNSAYAWLEMDFGIHLLHSDKAYDKKLDGTIKIDSTIGNKPVKAEFDLSFDESDSNGATAVTTYTMSGKYVTTPDAAPSLSDFLLYLAQNNPIDASLPSELDFDASMEGFTIEGVKKGDDNLKLQLAGSFELKIEGSTWDLYFAYTNDTSFDNPGSPATETSAAPYYVFGAALGGLIDLSKLPLVGKVPGVEKFRIDKLGFFYTNAAFTDQNKKLNFKVPEIGDPGKLAPNPTEAYLMQTGFSLVAVFGSQQDPGSIKSTGTMPLALDTGSVHTLAVNNPAFNSTASAPKDPIKWLEVNKTLGPVGIQKIGVAYIKASNPKTQLGTIGFYIDGSFKIAGFEMAIDRLGLSFDIPKPGTGTSFNPMNDIGFHLGGLFVNYQAPDFQISGGFISLPDDTGVNFIGEFTVFAGPFGLQAYGGFSNDMGHPSLFIFLHLNAPIGGPPFFFINGLAGGFGINRGFILPTFDELTSYPLLPSSNTIPTAGSLSGDPAAQLTVMSTALTNLAKYVPVQDGEYWFAVGLDVSCFEMIEVSAVLSFAFGVKFQIGLVGCASMTLPVKEPEPIAFIQIDFEVVFSPSDGLLAAFGKITPASYLFGPFIHLSGGFAFYTWFGGPNKGDFVVTIGGYNTHYQKPAYYPDVPRVELAFTLGSLSVSGQSYFALTGNAIMAGLSFHASWSLGPLSAWFDAGVDFLIGWKPFHYDADAYIEIGVALTLNVLFVRIKISISVGVMLEIWGPSFGGKAKIDLSIVSFTIYFGDDPQGKPQLDWIQFREFLPNINKTASIQQHSSHTSDEAPSNDNPPLVSISFSKGLLKSFKPGENPDGLDWLVDSNYFELQTGIIAPVTDAGFNKVSTLKNYPSYLDPDNLSAGIQNAVSKNEPAPFFAYKTEGDNPNWDTLAFGIPPMGLTGIHANYSVVITVLDSGNSPDNFIVILQTGSVHTALWGNNGDATASLNGKDAVIKGALNGFTIVPTLWFPARTALIPYYYLVFETNDLFLKQVIQPDFNTAAFADPGTIYSSVENGSAFSKTTTQRSATVELLLKTGFEYLALQNDGQLNTDQYAGEPILAHLS